MEAARIHVMPDGTAIYYRISRADRKSRGLIVLLHGMGSNVTRWSEFCERTALKSDWDILRLDLRGHGESMARCAVGLDVWSNDLIRLLDAEHAERAVLIGHSLGGHLALHFAARFPARVRGVVMIDPLFRQALRGRHRLLPLTRPLLSAITHAVRLLNVLGLRRRRFPRRDLRVLDEQVRMELLDKGLSDEFRRRYTSPMTDMKYLPVAHYLQEITETWRPLPPLASVPVPILVLLSRGLTYTDPARTIEIVSAAPNAEYQTIDAYHWPLTEQPEQVRRTIERWFSRLSDAP